MNAAGFKVKTQNYKIKSIKFNIVINQTKKWKRKYDALIGRSKIFT